MRRLKILAGALALAGLVLPVAADTVVSDVRQVILATGWDLDGEGADDNQVVVAEAISDSNSYTVAANPDTCRLVDVTVVDADSSITAGTITVTGTDCFGQTLVATYDFDASGSGAYSLTVTSGFASGAYFLTVASVEGGVMTGEGGGDTLAVGYAGDGTPAQYPVYGVLKNLTGLGDVANSAQIVAGIPSVRWIDPFDAYKVNLLITTSGAASTTVTSVNTDGPFTNVSVGDILLINQGGVQLQRKVTARASANSITVNGALYIASAGTTFSYKKFWVLADPIDGWIPVDGFDAAAWLFDVDGNTDTGGVVSDVSCAVLGPTFEPLEQIDTDTVASGATGEAVTALDLRLAPFYTHCRFGVEFGTNDDDDTGLEDINIVLGLRR